MGRKKTTNYYWTDDTERGIVRYNTTNKSAVKNKIYNEHLEYPFFKLTENIINTFKFSYFDDSFNDVQNECISFLVLNMHKYDHNKGSKAFSYFSVVIKNYLILNNNANYKKLKTHASIDNAKGVHQKMVNEDANVFIEETIDYFENKIPHVFSKHKDRIIAYAIIDLMKVRESIEDFNKKALYILLREMTNVDTAKITKVLNIMRKHMKVLHNNFYTEGSIAKLSKMDKFS
tara:strand:+ start:726 stop:1421 length:696 start_codon:yes stop_codon:yes gene_type:complete